MNRPETNPMKFGSDWTGVFFRGDHAIFYSLALDEAIHFLSELGRLKDTSEHPRLIIQLRELSDQFRACIERKNSEIEDLQTLPDWNIIQAVLMCPNCQIVPMEEREAYHKLGHPVPESS